MLRTDGNLLYETDGSSGAQTPVLDAATGQPLPGIVSVVEGEFHGCAMLSDGTVYCWRTSTQGNAYGELGNGTTDNSGPIFRATQVLMGPTQPLSGVKALSWMDAALSGNTCAIVGAGGNVYCWGNTQYDLNGGVALTSPYATEVTADGVTPFAGAVQLSIDGGVVCALVHGATSNEVWCWGANNSGAVGTGDRTMSKYPVKVVGLVNPMKVVPFGYYGTTCAIDGQEVRCWGDNTWGEVGNGTTNTPILAPALVTLMGGATPLTGIVDIVGGASQNFICALATDATVKCWGEGFASYPQNYNVANVVGLGTMDQSAVRLLTSDGLYHDGTITRVPNCGLLQ